MARRIIAAGYMAFGIASTIFWFVVIPHVSSWRPSRLTVGLLIAAIALANVAGLVYLIRGYRTHPRWLVAVGVGGNALSLFVIAYAVVGCLYLEYFFRM